ncbi:MAG: carbon-nitrogen hydrolase family protein [Colwellia sp.]|nr:carbon-nitrogen hydrolase family protein [Colwellia sp.]MCW8864976.1 carbon-nitrogen hydrolase family protein [Colwellia sp.]MCW9081728.1 carbon-nitrogen hydrolase family protein [Colwellia sp.]
MVNANTAKNTAAQHSTDKLNTVKLSAIQLNAKPNVEENLKAISRQLALITAKDNGDEHLVVLPECCLFFGANDKAQLQLAKNSQQSQKGFSSTLQLALSQLAQQYSVYLVAGTIPLLSLEESLNDKFSNASCVFNPEGEMLACYNKIHLFDVNVEDNEKSYFESRYTQAGNEPCVVKTPLANIGLSVCFDVRFPTLYQTLTALGADIITVPSAFTRVTGKAHWQTLLQARAIENQVYIIAAGQEGVHENGRETWGHSMIISPWGEILACLEQGEGFISSDFLPEEISRIRASMPLNSPLN